MRVRNHHFRSGLFEFLTELKANNNREWFNANKQRYVDQVEEPMLRFIADVGGQMKRVSRSFVADPRRVGGSMFRIYRDMRFSKDKAPFKPAVGAQFPHKARGKGRSVPGFYLHLEPGTCVGGGGIYHPDVVALGHIRDRMVAKPREWEGILRKGIPIEGDALKRAPAGYDPDHRFVQELKRKDLYSMSKFSERDVCSAAFLAEYEDACARAAPLVEFLTKALGLHW